jgi:hypothetical protein
LPEAGHAPLVCLVRGSRRPKNPIEHAFHESACGFTDTGDRPNGMGLSKRFRFAFPVQPTPLSPCEFEVSAASDAYSYRTALIRSSPFAPWYRRAGCGRITQTARDGVASATRQPLEPEPRPAERHALRGVGRPCEILRHKAGVPRRRHIRRWHEDGFRPSLA